MILRRFAFVIALLCAAVAAQIPEYIQQYRQRLGGAIDELARAVTRFDADSAQQGLDEAGAIDRLKANPDPLAQRRASAAADDRQRLDSLREAQRQLHGASPVGQLLAVLTHYDESVARGTFADFQPAVPTTAAGLLFGVAGFVFGGGVVHASGRPLRRRLRATRTV